MRHIKMDSAMTWDSQKSFSIAKETQEWPKNLIVFLKFALHHQN